jgi:uroporphyrin-III C-methyltransferase
MNTVSSEISAPNTPPTPPATPRRSGGAFGIFIALLALGLAGYGVWREHLLETGGESAAENRVNSQIETLTRAIDKVRGNTDTLRARMDDGDKVDKSAREELLSLSERARLVEDAVANLADKRLSGHDALLLNETELLLTLGNERFVLFHDSAATIAAYRLADTALSEVEDAAFSTVRQSISAEIEALNALQAGDPMLLSGQLAQLRQQLPELPSASRMSETAAPAQPTSRLWQVLGGLVQIHHGEDAQAQMVLRDVGLARELTALDLREAEAALLARDDVRYHAALAATRTQLTAFDATAPTVIAARSELDALDKAALAPPAPTILGTALKELRNLRATRALHAPVPAAPTNAGTQP